MKKEQAAQGSICHKNQPPPRLSCKRLLNARPPKRSQFTQRGRPQESRLGMSVVEVPKEEGKTARARSRGHGRGYIHPQQSHQRHHNERGTTAATTAWGGIRPIPTSIACACTWASSATVSNACHGADIVNNTSHHKHIAAAAAGLQCSRQNVDLIRSNGNDSNNSCDGSRSSGSSRACPPSFPNTVPPLPHVCGDGYSDSATAVQGHPSVADSLDGITIILIVVFFTPSQSSTTAAEAATPAAPPASTATPPVSLSAYAALADGQLGTDEIRSAVAMAHSFPAPYDGTVYVADSSTQSSTEEQTAVPGPPAAQAVQHRGRRTPCTSGDVPQQQDGVSCGLFALAYATLPAAGLHPLDLNCVSMTAHQLRTWYFQCVADREADVVELLLMKLLQGAQVSPPWLVLSV
ncbi:hypothetical protein PTSG_02863 [Salpingoeca rosetta]|uniref:Uncharacterized protein n=1 Tax=Salpingoeca rosetta (strain ATCC 50818 / BSB-021) TaxID=946362 RepID=F2U3J7_SALR5|nr:uncharacterized protein PTSG_02863 [Salpingoeca rosetta]EGD82191.1 hypothetical protein PTSG_02863 [Salpingoeca rosetta]|eukprot:XP_004996374.1 hypothetical protein PTSG_02863 [Salpingoeca rosetta]